MAVTNMTIATLARFGRVFINSESTVGTLTMAGEPLGGAFTGVENNGSSLLNHSSFPLAQSEYFYLKHSVVVAPHRENASPTFALSGN
jgi:hypothetical protein